MVPYSYFVSDTSDDLKILQVQVNFDNNRTAPILLKTSDLGKDNEQILVLNKSSVTYNNVLVRRQIVPSVNFRIYDLQSGNLLTTNDRINVTFKPREVTERLFAINSNLKIDECNGKFFMSARNRNQIQFVTNMVYFSVKLGNFSCVAQ